jgi:hypothetical protein
MHLIEQIKMRVCNGERKISELQTVIYIYAP